MKNDAVRRERGHTDKSDVRLFRPIAARAGSCDTHVVWNALRNHGTHTLCWQALGCALLAGSACGGRSTLDPGEPPRGGSPEPPAVTPPVAAAGSSSVEPMVPPLEPMLPPQPECEAVNLTIDELRPSVTLLVDQSGSMRQGYPKRGSAQTRWTVVRQALLDPMQGVVSTLQQSIQFGLVFYTSHNGFSGGACPMLSTVRAATDNYEEISKLYDRTSPDDDTPTGAAIDQVVTEIAGAHRKGPEVLLLVTDGDPDTCQVPDPQEGQVQAISAAAKAFAAGVDFYVLGVSSDISGDKLQQLANAGKGKPLSAIWGVDPDAAQPFQASDNVAGLTAQLRGILEGVPLCEVELERDIAFEELARSSVTLDGEALPYGTPDGFRLKDARHLEIVGKACEALRVAGKRLSVSISCDE